MPSKEPDDKYVRVCEACNRMFSTDDGKLVLEYLDHILVFHGSTVHKLGKDLPVDVPYSFWMEGRRSALMAIRTMISTGKDPTEELARIEKAKKDREAYEAEYGDLT